jgi:DNA-binding HxlR family transcriptional regulator
MSVHTNLGKQDKSGLTDARSATFMASYLDVLTLVERLHRLLLDVIKDEFERVGILEINAVQALLLFNIAENEVTYNLKKLVELGYMHHQRSEIDRRSVRVRLTEKGRNVRLIVAKLFATHADGLLDRQVLDHAGLDGISTALRRVERYWSDQIRYIY